MLSQVMYLHTYDMINKASVDTGGWDEFLGIVIQINIIRYAEQKYNDDM